MIFAIKKQHAVLAVQIKYPVSVSQYRIKESIIFTKLSLENLYLEVQNTSCNRNEPKQSIGTPWQITEVSNSENSVNSMDKMIDIFGQRHERKNFFLLISFR